MLVALALVLVAVGLVLAGLGWRARRLFLHRIAQLDREMRLIRGFIDEERRKSPPLEDQILN